MTRTQSQASAPHILVVDDDDRIRTLLHRYLREQGLTVSTARNAQEARSILAVFDYDGLIIDVMMPGEDGFALTTDLRKNMDIPVLLLTALGETQQRIEGLESGADDYLPKPFDPRELLLRLQSVMRRRPEQVRSDVPVTIGAWIFYPDRDEIVGKDASEPKAQSLTSVEGTLLRALCQRAGEVLSRETLAEMCRLQGGERTIDVQVTRLRRKLEEDTRNPRHLQTIRGEGYILRLTHDT